MFFAGERGGGRNATAAKSLKMTSHVDTGVKRVNITREHLKCLLIVFPKQMHVPDTDIFQAGLFSSRPAALGMGFGCCGKVVEIKPRIKRQQILRNLRIEG